MKTAKFQFVGRNGEKVLGTVVLKADQKVSVSLNSFPSGYSSSALKYQAKHLGYAIAKADFVHEAITSLKVVNDTSKLITELFEKTADLKEAFIIKTKEYSFRYFENAKKKLLIPVKEWYDEYEIKYNPETLMLDSKEYNRKNLYRMRAAVDNLKSIVSKGFEKFEAGEVKTAINHYESSIRKLASRLTDKGITDDSNFEIVSGRVGHNFECTIKHGNETTRAWTIIAEGEINRAHFRYLVK